MKNKYKRLTRLFYLVAAFLLSTGSYAATVDGSPGVNFTTDTGMYVWREANGDWRVRYSAGNTNRLLFAGTFEATMPFGQINNISIEAVDVVTLSAPAVLDVGFDVWAGGYDGLDFTIDQTAGICLRDTSGAGTVVYLGANAVQATTPVDLTGSGACEPPPPVINPGLYISSMGGGDWQVLLSPGVDYQHFSGEFEATNPFGLISPVSLESSDIATLTAPSVLYTEFEVWAGGVDGVDFSVPNNTGICLREIGSYGVSVYLENSTTPAILPLDITGSGACNPAPAPAPSGNSGLFISSPSSGKWEVRLLSVNEHHQFTGTFDATETIQTVTRVSLESVDITNLSAPSVLNTKFEVWSGGVDGVDITLGSNSGLCLRDVSGSGVPMYLGNSTTPVSAPVDITNSGACDVAPPPPPPTGSNKPVTGHYIFPHRGQSSQTIMLNSIKPGVVGIVKRYTWRKLEPTLGVYDFSEVVSDLNFLADQGMQFIIMIEDKTFTLDKPTPDYLFNKYTVAGKQGYTAVRWDPYVVTRKKALIKALGNRFDSHPNFEGIANQESAPSLDAATLDAAGYTPEKYRDALIAEIREGSLSLPTSRFFWFMNFLPRNNDYLSDIAAAAAPLGNVVMGTPDIMPDSASLVLHTYPIYDKFYGKLPMFGQVEPAVYHHEHLDTSFPTKYWTMKELMNWGVSNMHTNYIFWVRVTQASPADSYTWDDALPVIANNPALNP